MMEAIVIRSAVDGSGERCFASSCESTNADTVRLTESDHRWDADGRPWIAERKAQL